MASKVIDIGALLPPLAPALPMSSKKRNCCWLVVQFYGGPRKEKYQTYNAVLTELNMAFTIMFTIEMILKQLGFGIRVRRC